jgi:hypothetical protein
MTTRKTLLDQHELLQKAERYIPGASLGMIVLPADLRMVMVRGLGSKVYDAAGKEYLDYMLNSACSRRAASRSRRGPRIRPGPTSCGPGRTQLGTPSPPTAGLTSRAAWRSTPR